LLKEQSNFSLVIILAILITIFLQQVLILLEKFDVGHSWDLSVNSPKYLKRFSGTAELIPFTFNSNSKSWKQQQQQQVENEASGKKC